MTTNDFIYILIIILILIVIVHHLKKENCIENFKTSNDYIIGENKENLGNPNLSHLKKNITIKNNLGNFSKFRNIKNSKHEKLFLDSNKQILLHSNGFVIIDLETLKDINAFHISGLKKFRVDISLNNKEFKLLFKGKESNHNIFTKEIINNVNNKKNNNTPIKAQQIKITNTDIKHSKTVKVEIYTKDNLILKSTLEKAYTVQDENENNISSKYYINNENNSLSHLLIKSKSNISSFTLITNVPNFMVLNKKKKQFLEGGIDGIVKIRYHINPTNEFKLLPIINEKIIDTKMFFIQLVEVYKQNIIEGFVENSSKDTELINEINNTIEIQKACQALENAEAIANSKDKLEKNKTNYLILENQMKQIKILENQIEEITTKRNNHIQKKDKLSVAKFNNLAVKEDIITDIANKRLKEQLNFNLNLIPDNFTNPNTNPINSTNTNFH